MNIKIRNAFSAIKICFIFLLIGLAAAACPAGQKTNQNSDYEIGTWQDFKQAAICFTFDDQSRNQYDLAIPMFDKYGFKLTMFITTRWSPDWNLLKKAAASGHEIASHTLSHAKLASLTDIRQEAEMADSQNEINQNIGGKECLTLAYPDCVTGLYEIVSKYYIAARGCQGFIEHSTPADFLNISSIICGISGAVQSETDFINMTDNAISANGLCVFLIHAINDDVGYSPLDAAILEKELVYLVENQDKVWVATFENIVKYIRERDALTISENTVEKNRIIFKATDNLDNGIYDYPVSIRRRLPPGWAGVFVSQNGKQINAAVVTIDSVRYVTFAITPDTGDVTLSPE